MLFRESFVTITLAGICLAQSGKVPAFEVVSVKPHQGSPGRLEPLAVSGTLIRLEGYTIMALMLDAWNLRDFQISFGKVATPEDLFDTMYDVVGKAAGDKPPSLADARAMLQGAMTDRFRIAVHREQKEMPVYTVTVGKGLPAGLNPNRSGDPCAVNRRAAADGRNFEYALTSCDMERFADVVGHLIHDRPVLNQTGLTGNYDMRLVAKPDNVGRDEAPDDIPAVTALARVGLKLSKQRAPVEVVVVDHWEKPRGN